jgi:CheY-like chemotaxis protein
MRADASRLQQVIVNLLQNAINHSMPHNTVRVSLEVRGDLAVIGVNDQGEGIALDALPAIFEPFVQATRRSVNGMGLGLSLARSIARAHGGDVLASSDGPGKGARFEVHLPLGDVASAAAVEPPLGEQRAAAGTPSVLLIDDDDASRQSIGMLLRSSGYQVHEAPDGQTGLRLIDEAMPTVALVDIGLPDVSGLEIARRVRAKYGSNQIRLVALTGFGRQADREAAIEAGCDMHLVKPIDFATLERVIAYQVAR